MNSSSFSEAYLIIYKLGVTSVYLRSTCTNVFVFEILEKEVVSNARLMSNHEGQERINTKMDTDKDRDRLWETREDMR